MRYDRVLLCGGPAAPSSGVSSRLKRAHDMLTPNTTEVASGRQTPPPPVSALTEVRRHPLQWVGVRIGMIGTDDIAPSAPTDTATRASPSGHASGGGGEGPVTPLAAETADLPAGLKPSDHFGVEFDCAASMHVCRPIAGVAVGP